MQDKKILFTPFQLGPLKLRNRSIRAAAFEGMCPNNSPSQDLHNYHRAVAAGGVGMTTVAYTAIDRSGLSFPHQLWIRKDVLPELIKLTDAVHNEGAACSIQLGHCGNMAKQSVTGERPLAPSARINLYGPTFPKSMNKRDIEEKAINFGNAVKLARESGFDAVEIHAGHGYLISQFLSPYTNKRKDEFGGSFKNRTLFMRMVMDRVTEAAKDDIAILVKMNMNDGFESGMHEDEAVEVAKILEESGANALVLSGGFVSKAPMYILKGAMPIKVLAHYMTNPAMKLFTGLFGNQLIKNEPFEEAYFLKSALRFRDKVSLPLVYVGGLVSNEKIEQVLNNGFEMVAIARALIKDPDFINKLLQKEFSRSSCDTCNYCIAVMYNQKFECAQNVNIPDDIKKMLYNK